MPRARNYHGRQCQPLQQRSGHRQRRHTTAVPPPSRTHHPRPSRPPASAPTPTPITTFGPYYYGYFNPHYHIRPLHNLHQESYDQQRNRMTLTMNLSLLDGPITIFRWIYNRFRDPEEDDNDTHDLILVSSNNEYHGNLVSGSNGGLSKETIAENVRISTYRVSDDVDETTIGLCVVCQEDFSGEDEKIATLDCGHYYHVECIKKWLLQKNCCPVCKAIGLDVNWRTGF